MQFMNESRSARSTNTLNSNFVTIITRSDSVPTQQNISIRNIAPGDRLANLKLHRLLYLHAKAVDDFLVNPLKEGDDCVFSWKGKQVEGIIRKIHASGCMDVEYTQAGMKCPSGHKLVLDMLNPKRFSRPEPRFCSSPEWVAATVEATGFAAEEVRAFILLVVKV